VGIVASDKSSRYGSTVVCTRSKRDLFTAITSFTNFHAKKSSSIACYDDDCCGFVEKACWCTCACNFFDRCEVEFPADYWKTPLYRRAATIHRAPLNSLSAAFSRVVHSFSLRVFRDKLLHVASKQMRVFPVFQRKSTIFTFDCYAPGVSEGVCKHVNNSHYWREPRSGS